jgi:hypothetical protein
VLERLAAAVVGNPMDALEGLREPLSEGVRMLLLDEVQEVLDRLRNMTKWPLAPALQCHRTLKGGHGGTFETRPARRAIQYHRTPSE